MFDKVLNTSLVLKDVGTAKTFHSANDSRFNILSFDCQELQKKTESEDMKS